MVTLTQLIESCGHDPSLPKSAKNVYGTGHMLHVGYTVKCAGLMGPNPDFDRDSAAGLNPPAETLNQHVIGVMTAVPDAGADGIPCERADEATFEIDPAQTAMDPTNPVCMTCGQKPIL